MLRNRRTIIFTLVFPAALLPVFGGQDGWDDPRRPRQRRGVHPGLDGACTAPPSPRRAAARWSPSSGRSGWSRQLRLTPLNPVAYILIKTARGAGAWAPWRSSRSTSSASCRARPSMPTHIWLRARRDHLVRARSPSPRSASSSATSCPARTRCRSSAPVLALLSFLGGVFIPLDQYSDVVRHIAYWTPMYGVAEHRPLAAHPRAALVRRWSTPSVWFAVFVGRRRLADEQGHGPRVTVAVTAMSSTPVDAERPSRSASLGSDGSPRSGCSSCSPRSLAGLGPARQLRGWSPASSPRVAFARDLPGVFVAACAGGVPGAVPAAAARLPGHRRGLAVVLAARPA